ncbi:MAG: hypothetical protein LBR66_09080 [Candidatus Symbiothrix sp.]|jgi:hypothetical protein|nr:hypothetical protein [Candidatus Symbiothrix sp.]
MKKIILSAIAIALAAGSSFAFGERVTRDTERASIKQRTENWGKHVPLTTPREESGSLRISNPTTPPTVPVGGGLLCLVALAGAYALRKQPQ